MIIIGKRYSFFKKCDFSPSLLMQASWVLWLNEIVRSLTTLFIILTRDMALLLKATYIPTKTEVGFEGSPYRPVLQYFHGGTVVLTYEYCSTLLIELNEYCNLCGYYNLLYLPRILRRFLCGNSASL